MTTYNSTHNIPGIWIQKEFNNQGTKKHMFKWYECGILGCGPESKPWLDLTEFVRFPENAADIIAELQTQLDASGHRPGGGTCMLPKELNNYHFMTYYQYFAEKYVPEEVRNSFKTSQELDAWVTFNLGKPIWECALILKKQTEHSRYWTGKHNPGAAWQDPDKQGDYRNQQVHGVTGRVPGPVPLTKAWINEMETYLFKHIGRVLVYQNKVGHAVPTHRDYPANSFGHSAHFVNIQLTTSNRKGFMYDEVTKEKIYTSSKAYMFNESDCHGVDPEDENHFTIRIDGEFQDHVCEKLGFVNGQVFSMDYKNGYKFNNIKIFEPEFDNEA